MKFPYGADEDAAYIIAWLELNNFKGISILNHLIKIIDNKYNGVINLKDIKEVIDFKNQSILMKGSGLIDYLQSTISESNKKISINIKNCNNGILFLPLLYKLKQYIQFSELSFSDIENQVNKFQVIDDKILYNVEDKQIPKNQVKIILSNTKLDEKNNLFKEIITKNIIQKNLSRSLSPNKQHWETISNIANRTFVPESEESRKRGAGGGDAND